MSNSVIKALRLLEESVGRNIVQNDGGDDFVQRVAAERMQESFGRPVNSSRMIQEINDNNVDPDGSDFVVVWSDEFICLIRSRAEAKWIMRFAQGVMIFFFSNNKIYSLNANQEPIEMDED